MGTFRSGKNTPTKILSFAAALIVWFHVTIGATFTTTASIPIRYIGPMRGLVLAEQVPDHILVQVRGSGKALLAWSFRGLSGKSGRSVLVNLAGLPGGKHTVSIRPDQVSLGAEGVEATRILEYAEFPVTLDLKVQRTVAVLVDSLPGLRVSSDTILMAPPSATPKYVTIEGPESIVRTIASVPVAALVPNEVSLRDTVLSAEISEHPIPFVTVNPRKVSIRFIVEPLSERVLSGIPVRRSEFPRSRYDIEPDSLTATVRGAESVVSLLKPHDITVTLPFRPSSDRSKESVGAVKPLVAFPKGISAVTITPETVRVTPRGGKG